MKFQIILLAGLACSLLASPVVDPKVFDILDTKDTTTVIVSFTKSNVAGVRSTFAKFKTTLKSRSAKLNTFYHLLKDHADTVQVNVLAYLEKARENKSLKISQSWITNQLIIKGIDKQTIFALGNMDDIKEIVADKLIPLQRDTIAHGDVIGPDANQWGVEKIRASNVWYAPGGNKGEGVVVATIDTGVRGTHEALKNNHRKEYGWLDPSEGTKTPTDSSGYGTHTMGIICGQTNGIGVAPGAKWISCRACGYTGCYLADLLQCANFLSCPTDIDGNNPNCSMAPHLISNTWGGGQGDDWFDDVLAAWKDLNIASFFPIGGSGPSYRTANSPGDSELTIAVGATNSDDTLSSRHSRGPSLNGLIKPDIVAPGSNIYSSFGTADDSYSIMSGSSVAAQHVAGVAALVYGKIPNLKYDEVKKALFLGAQRTVNFTGKNCGGIRDDEFPNNEVGWGLVDALNTFNAVF